MHFYQKRSKLGPKGPKKGGGLGYRRTADQLRTIVNDWRSDDASMDQYKQVAELLEDKLRQKSKE